MTRKTPKSPPPIKEDDRAGWVRQIRKYEVITPLYGGGEETQKADSITVVRATEVRGHLRFWWRATRGGAFDGNLKRMRDAEEEIWGSSREKEKSGPSQVSVRIVMHKDVKHQEEKQISKLDVYSKKADKNIPTPLGDPKSPWSYVAFPLREEKDEHGEVRKPAGSVLQQGVEFDLELNYPQDLGKEVEPALWAWERFGGIGARTRRGFGALQCLEITDAITSKKIDVISPKTNEINDAYFKKDLTEDGKWPDGVPHLSKKLRYRIVRKKGDAVHTWEYLFGALQSFRQERYSKFGLSTWPEANEVRRLHDQEAKLPKEPPDVVLLNKFPRAKFGLPIQFNMPKDPALAAKKIELHGRKKDEKKYIDRLASPLILRPIACSDGAVGLAVILEWEPLEPGDERYTPPGGLILKGAPNDQQVWSDLDEDEASTIPPLQGNTDVLQAFLDSLR